MSGKSGQTEIQARMQQLSGTHYVNGSWVAGSGARHDVIDPATGEPSAQFADATSSEVDQAVAHAAREGVALLRLFTLWHEDFYASLGWQVEERTSLHGTPVVIMSIVPAERVAHTEPPPHRVDDA